MRSSSAQRCARHASRHDLPLRPPPRRHFQKRFNSTANLSKPTKARFNDLGVQQVSTNVYNQLFSGPETIPPPEFVALAKDHLKRHDLYGKNQDSTPPIAFDLPDLQGATFDEHFYKLGMDAAEPYLTLARQLALSNPPPRPRKWLKRSGWTKYHADGTHEPVHAPDESMLSFDTEVMYKETSFPCLACAASPTAWYAWVSPWLLGESDSDRHLIPLGDPTQPRVIVGHHIGYDRARVLEEYNLVQTKNYFMDTMSLHVAVNGMCTRQRPTWMKQSKARDLRDQISNSAQGADLHALLNSDTAEDEEEHLWVGRSSVNSLRDVAKFHCGITIDKAKREYFGELDRAGIVGKYDELLDYCAADVDITHRVYRRVFPAFLENSPHPVSFAALRHLSTEILPINKSWETYIENAEQTYHTLLDDVQKRLIKLTDAALDIKTNPSKYQDDPWLRQLDWLGQEVKMTKAKKTEESRPVKRQKMPGMPNWYKALFPVKDGPINLTVRTRVAPLLLRMAWDGYPLVWSDKHGWTFKVPAAESSAYEKKAVIKCDMHEEENIQIRLDFDHDYYKLPHKDGPSARCANPLAKGYLSHFEKGTLSSEYHYAKEALEMNASCSYWISARDRIRSQMVVYQGDVQEDAAKDNPVGFILPQIIPMGTVTRRAVENTWLTASNAKSNRVGSELKSMVTAPPGYCFVGADVDSEELWIASLMGDAQFQLHGGNAIGFMTLEGTKAAGTDLHSRTAKILGISRNDAKVFNYGRIYGAGLNFAQTLLKQFNPDLDVEQTSEIAGKLYQETKGQKTTRKALRKRGFWRGGTESFLFNTLEDFAEQDEPRTPVLGVSITEALMRRYISKGEFMTSRVNWAIQSSGVDYLHLLIVSMDYLARRYNIDARLAITVHDEIRYLVKESDKYRAAMALQVANVWTRAMFSQQVGINDLPQSCAYFSAVDIDHVLRKEVDMDCITPSNLKAIAPGESVDIIQLLAKGTDAYLDPATRPNETVKPQRYAYTPREPVMAALQRDSKTDLNYLRAQVTTDDEELKDIIKDVRSPGSTSSTKSTAAKKSTTPKPRKIRAMTTSKRRQPHGMTISEKSWYEHRREQGFKEPTYTVPYQFNTSDMKVAPENLSTLDWNSMFS